MKEATAVIMGYKGYVGDVHFDEEAGVFRGEVNDTQYGVVTFQGKTQEEARHALEQSVDDYLALCKEKGAIGIEGLTFGQILEKLLDESELFSREEWADFLGLGVPTSTINDWVQNQSFPTPACLFVMADVLKGSDVPEATLILLAELMSSPMNKTVHGSLPELPYGSIFPEWKTFGEYSHISTFSIHSRQTL